MADRNRRVEEEKKRGRKTGISEIRAAGGELLPVEGTLDTSAADVDTDQTEGLDNHHQKRGKTPVDVGVGNRQPDVRMPDREKEAGSNDAAPGDRQVGIATGSGATGSNSSGESGSSALGSTTTAGGDVPIRGTSGTGGRK